MRIKFLISLFLISSYTLFAQTDTTKTASEIGLKAGGNYALFQVDNYSRFKEDAQYPTDFTGKFGFYVGAYIKIPLSNRFAFKPEILYTYRSMEQEILTGTTFANLSTNTISIKQQLIAVPLLVTYKIANKVHLEAGPQIGYVIANSSKVSNGSFTPMADDSAITNSNYDKLEVAGIIGATYSLTSCIDIEANFGYGLAERNSSFSNVYRIGLNYKL